MKTYAVLTGTAPISMTRSKPGTQCGNCRTEDREIFQIRGTIQLGKRAVSIRFEICLTCFDHWADFVKSARIDGHGAKPRDTEWYPEGLG